MRRKLLLPWIALALAFLAAEPALAGNGGVAPPEPASPTMDWIRDSFWLVSIFTGAIFVLVEGALILFIVKYRGRGRSPREEGPQVVGHHRLEIIWTVIPVLILAVIGSYMFYKLPGINDPPAANAAGKRIEIDVEGRQFYWRYTYPNGRVSVNELRVPVGRVVQLNLTAPDFDVIHSWWVPQLAGKKDAIPGKVNTLWFEAERPGLYRGQCAEFCGDQHALMLAQVLAQPPAEYDAWVNGPPAGLGEQTWQGACAPCHGMRAQGLIGPKLAGGTIDPERIKSAVRNGRNEMPAVGRGWDERQLNALIAYMTREFGRQQQGAQSGG